MSDEPTKQHSAYRAVKLSMTDDGLSSVYQIVFAVYKHWNQLVSQGVGDAVKIFVLTNLVDRFSIYPDRNKNNKTKIYHWQNVN